MAGNPKNVITLKAALTERLGDDCSLPRMRPAFRGRRERAQGRYIYRHGFSRSNQPRFTDDQQSIAEAVEIARKADVAILALGEPTNWMEGEAASRTTLGFTGAQEQLLEAVVATGKPVVLVVLAARPWN